MAKVCPMVTGAGSDQDYIINMDQLPIPFNFDRQRSLELVGAHMSISTKQHVIPNGQH